MPTPTPNQEAEKRASSPIFVYDEDEKKFVVPKEEEDSKPPNPQAGSGNDPNMVTISVSRAFAEEATLKAVSELRREVTKIQEDLTRTQERAERAEALAVENQELKSKIEKLENELGTVKEVAEDAKTTVEKLKLKMKEKHSRLKTRILANEEQNITTQLYRRIVSKLGELEIYDGPQTPLKQVLPIKFMAREECHEMGWEREFRDRLKKVVSRSDATSFRDNSSSLSVPLSAGPQLNGGQDFRSHTTGVTHINFINSTKNKFLYLPGRVTFPHRQHGLAVAPTGQKSADNTFELASSFNELFGKTWELFYDRPTKHEASQIYYAGTYRCIGLGDIPSDGLKYQDWSENEWDLSVPSLTQAVIEAQLQRPLLRREEICDLITSGIITLQVIGLKMIGWNEHLYHSVTNGTYTPGAGTKRPSNHPSSQLNKRSKH
ncbi:hypothetical protein VNI00_008650 [Paramarasmius palmivorus]|uniref:Uncharacterized protein n=1 Tax=Paramarasmius palmivorus TaxID=297713 RepID=A0AAW0CXT4_9AGAR